MSATTPTRIAIFASGGGSNAEKIIEYFADSPVADVVLLLSNSPKSGIFTFGPVHNISSQLLDKKQYRDGSYLIHLLKEVHNIDLIVLAGYLKLLPAAFTQAYPNAILNIHPSLLPKFGGKGMYGMHVHEAVMASDEHRSGMTIHFVNEVYDEGEILLQKALMIEDDWDAKQLQKEVLKLEHKYFSPAIEKVCLRLQQERNIG